MRGIHWVAVVALAACTGSEGSQGAPGAAGAQGTQGAQGPAGAQGPQGPAGGSVDGGGASGDAGAPLLRQVWRDHSGAQIQFLSFPGGGNWILVADANANIWETSATPIDGIPVARERSTYYGQAGCAGDAYVPGYMVGGPVFILGTDPTLRRVPANANYIPALHVLSIGDSGGCAPVDEMAPVILATETVPATPIVKPAKLFDMPYHLELVP